MEDLRYANYIRPRENIPASLLKESDTAVIDPAVTEQTLGSSKQATSPSPRPQARVVPRCHFPIVLSYAEHESSLAEILSQVSPEPQRPSWMPKHRHKMVQHLRAKYVHPAAGNGLRRGLAVLPGTKAERRLERRQLVRSRVENKKTELKGIAGKGAGIR
ncbi:hypothetical protein HDU93_000684 [Gonapodya sp. JEL0774]|nr:hypothetical protein HDU93_000684 [Gonapodya sp. JEL0774]